MDGGLFLFSAGLPKRARSDAKVGCVGLTTSCELLLLRVKCSTMSMFVDETAADVPVKDINLSLFSQAGAQESLVNQNARERQAISRVSREELEDKFLRLHEENLLLKQHGHNQEDKIKRLATKLVKLVKDRRRMEQLVAGGAPRPPAPAAGRDMEMEEMMEELQDKVRALQQQNEGLKQRLLVAKQQLQVQSRKPAGPYGRVQSRVNTGLKGRRDDSPTPSPMPPRGTRNVEVEGSGRPPTGLLPRYGHSLLEEARAEIRNLENVMERQQGDIEDMMRESQFLRDKLKRKEKEYEESLLQLREQQTTGQRSTIQNNVEMIKLQKQWAEKANAMTLLEGRFLQLQDSQKTMKASHDAVMSKVDELMVQLKDERLKGVGLESRLQTASISHRRTEELQEQINDLEKERDLLKDNCDKLVNSAFDVSQEQKWRLREQQLKLQIAQLEVALKADLTDKNEILDKIKAERDTNGKLTEENKRLEIQFLEQKQQLEEVGERLAFYSKESELDASELSEALILIKVRRSQKRGELGFLQQVEEELQGDTARSMGELQATYVETYQELEKTRDMLIVQHKINKDYQAEVEAATQKLESGKIEYELRLDQQAQLLDMRAAKIKKLEAQLKNIAYGTKAYVFTPDITDEDVADEFDETVHLERGENLLEIHIGNGALSSSALEALGDREPSTFCTYAFYDFELHATPVVHGSRPAYGFTSQYVVRVDDVFLQYLHTRAVTVELHLAKGMDFQTVAAGQLQLQQLLEKDGKVYGEVQLVGVYGEVQSFGSVEYWARLRVPMEQAIQLYKERVKALGYISTTLNEEKQASATNLPPLLASPGSSSTNELNVTIRCCCDLSVQGGRPPPSSYVVYRFFDFPDHDTRVVPDCCEPRFDDHVSYPVAMDADLDGYLKAKSLQLYVFDDQEAQVDTYLGKAQVPLLSLAHDKAITGLFELIDPSGRSVGHIELTLKWKCTYLPPPGSTMTVEQAKFIPRDKAVKLTNEAEGTLRHDVKEGKKEEKNTKEVELKEEEEEKETETTPDLSASLPAMSSIKAPLPKPRLKPQTKQKPVSKRVTFIDNTATEEQVAERSMENVPLDKGGNAKLPPVKVVTPAPPSAKDVTPTPPRVEDVTPTPPSAKDVTPTPPSAKDVTPTPPHVEDVTPTPPRTEEKEELEDEDLEVTHFSEGQLIPSVSGPSARSYSDDSEISEDIIEEDIEGAPAEGEDQSGSIQSDSDDCIVPGQASAGRKPAQCLRVEIVSLSLRPESRAARDPSVVRLFVEYSLLDLPSEETPLSLPKPQPGKSSHYHYSNVIHMDVENNRARRELLKAVLEGRNPQMDSIRFNVVSEPPEAEEQERECEDVGVAYLRIPDILEKQRDLIETNLNVVDAEDSSSVVGSLMVSVEGLEALQSIMEDPDHDYTPVSSLQTLTSNEF